MAYKFVGKFAARDIGESCPTGQDPSDIVGKLIKLKNGKRIAVESAGFNLDCGC